MVSRVWIVVIVRVKSAEFGASSRTINLATLVTTVVAAWMIRRHRAWGLSGTGGIVPRVFDRTLNRGIRSANELLLHRGVVLETQHMPEHHVTVSVQR